MPVIEIRTLIEAPVERCFDLARDIDFHVRSLAATDERAIAGKTTGLIELGESVTWEAKHFHIRQRFTAKVIALQRPTFFRDVMTKGAFRSFAHDHHFAGDGRNTLMTDVVTFRSPLGLLGRCVDRFILAPYLRRMLQLRCQALKEAAEDKGAEPAARLARRSSRAAVAPPPGRVTGRTRRGEPCVRPRFSPSNAGRTRGSPLQDPFRWTRRPPPH